MSQNLIIFLGGTGQAVLHYYAQRYLLGNLKNKNPKVSPFHAHVVDTDALYGGVQRFKLFLKRAQYGQDETDGMTVKLPRITTNDFKRSSDKVVKVLTGKTDPKEARYTVASAFFDQESMAQNVSEGLYARPSLASVIVNKELASQLPENVIDNGSRVILVSSIIGGTGGGLSAPLLDIVRRIAEDLNIVTNVRFYGVFFGKYFQPTPGKLQNAEQRFSSNRDLVLKSIEEAIPQLTRYFLIEPKYRELRKTDEEAKGEFQSWPNDPNHLLWLGTRAVEYLRTETITQQVVEFSDKRISIDQLNEDGFDLPGLINKRDFRIAFVDKVIREKVIERLVSEPLAKSIWGNEFTTLVAHYFNLAVGAMDDRKRARVFPEKVQTAMRTIWNGIDKNLGLRSLFPELKGKKTIPVYPSDLQKLIWPLPTEQHRLDLSTNMDTASEVFAESLILSTLYQ